MISAYIFGAGQEYEKLISVIRLHSSEILIKGVVTTRQYYAAFVDGYPTYALSDAPFAESDYVILAVGAGWQEAMQSVSRYVSVGRIIRSKVFLTPFFDLAEYLRLKDSRCSILSNFCLGGIVSDQLGLEFLSPTVNMVCLGEEFIKFVNNFEEYLSVDMVEYKDETYIPRTRGTETFMGKGLVRDVTWYFRHSRQPAADVKKWNERRHRVNPDNIAVMMVLFTRDEVELFEKIPVKKKLGLFFEPTEYEDILYIPGWDNMGIRFEHEFRWAGYAQKYVLYPVGHILPVNWMKFLNGGEYLRVKEPV